MPVAMIVPANLLVESIILIEIQLLRTKLASRHHSITRNCCCVVVALTWLCNIIRDKKRLICELALVDEHVCIAHPHEFLLAVAICCLFAAKRLCRDLSRVKFTDIDVVELVPLRLAFLLNDQLILLLNVAVIMAAVCCTRMHDYTDQVILIVLRRLLKLDPLNRVLLICILLALLSL